MKRVNRRDQPGYSRVPSSANRYWNQLPCHCVEALDPAVPILNQQAYINGTSLIIPVVRGVTNWPPILELLIQTKAVAIPREALWVSSTALCYVLFETLASKVDHLQIVQPAHNSSVDIRCLKGGHTHTRCNQAQRSRSRFSDVPGLKVRRARRASSQSCK